MSDLKGWGLNSTGCCLEFSKGSYFVVLRPQEDFYLFDISVYDGSKYRLEKDFKNINEALHFIDRVTSGDIDYE